MRIRSFRTVHSRTLPFVSVTVALLLAFYKISVDAPSPFLYEEGHTILHGDFGPVDCF